MFWKEYLYKNETIEIFGFNLKSDFMILLSEQFFSIRLSTAKIKRFLEKSGKLN